MKLLILPFLLLLLAGCQDVASDGLLQGEKAPLIAAAPGSYVYGSPAAHYNIHHWGRLQGEERARAQAASSASMRRASIIAAQVFAALGKEPERPFTQRLEAAKQTMASFGGDEYAYQGAQLVAFSLLEEHLTAGDLNTLLTDRSAVQAPRSVKSRQAIAWAAQLLATNHNPNADLVADALTAQGDVLSGQARQAVARQAVQNAQVWLAAEAGCEDCGARPAGAGESQRALAVRSGMSALQGHL